MKKYKTLEDSIVATLQKGQYSDSILKYMGITKKDLSSLKKIKIKYGKEKTTRRKA